MKHSYRPNLRIFKYWTQYEFRVLENMNLGDKEVIVSHFLKRNLALKGLRTVFLYTVENWLSKSVPKDTEAVTRDVL